MNQNKGVVYFDSSKTNEDTLVIGKENELVSETGLEKQENYKERHKDDIYTVSRFRRIVDTFLPAVIVSVIVFIIFQFVLLNGTVPSGSMEPTINTGNLILSNRLAFINEEPEVGNIVVFWSEEHEKLLVKRVIGVAGDTIELKDGKVYINGDLVVEAYTQGETWSASGNDQTFVVPEGKLFVMGDNRENSADSRYFKDTFISVDSVKGEAFLHYSLGGDDGIYVKTLRSESPIVVNQ